MHALDMTGSMSSYIAAVQSNVQRIVTEVAASEKCSVRFGLVSYRDHPPQDSSYITKEFPFTTDLDTMRANVNTMVRVGRMLYHCIAHFRHFQYCVTSAHFTNTSSLSPSYYTASGQSTHDSLTQQRSLPQQQ
jgi:hypothetical protein